MYIIVTTVTCVSSYWLKCLYVLVNPELLFTILLQYDQLIPNWLFKNCFVGVFHWSRPTQLCLHYWLGSLMISRLSLCVGCCPTGNQLVLISLYREPLPDMHYNVTDLSGKNCWPVLFLASVAHSMTNSGTILTVLRETGLS